MFSLGRCEHNVVKSLAYSLSQINKLRRDKRFLEGLLST